MQQQRRRNTGPEMALRSELHRRGLRFRVDRAPLAEMRSRADIVFGPARVAVFVDGCFWHGCPLHGTQPKANATWWTEKLGANRRRDASTTAFLEASGWAVVRVWEHENPITTADVVATLVKSRRPSGGQP